MKREENKKLISKHLCISDDKLTFVYVNQTIINIDQDYSHYLKDGECKVKNRLKLAIISRRNKSH